MPSGSQHLRCFDKASPDVLSQTSLTKRQAQQQCHHRRSELWRSAKGMSWLIIWGLPRLAIAEPQLDSSTKEMMLLIVPVGASH